MQLSARIATIFCLLSVGIGQPSLLGQGATPAPSPAPIAHPAYPTGTAHPLGETIAALLADPAVSRAHWGIAVTTLDGTPLFGFDEGKYFRPASNNKIFTTAAAMHLLGPGFLLITSAGPASVADTQGNLTGDIILHGSGDATFASGLFPYRSPSDLKSQATSNQPKPDPLQAIDELADSIAKAHITHITGNVVGDDTVWPWEPYATGWELDDTVWGYGAPISALTLHDNQIVLTVTPAAVGQPATVAVVPDTGYYQLQMNVQTVAAGQAASLDIDRAPSSRLVRIFGTIAADKPYTTEIAIDDPAEFAAQAFKTALEAHGVKIDGKAMARHRLRVDPADVSDQSRIPLPGLPMLAVGFVEPASSLPNCSGDCPVSVAHSGPPLAEDVKLILKVSQNLHAEMLLHLLGKTYGTDGSTAQGVRVVRQFLLNAGLDPNDFLFYDGSGLSSHDLITPRATATFLAFAAKQPWFPAWKASLPEGGEDGGLDKRFPNPPLKDHLFAKTGTLGETHALSGYLDAASGRAIIFSIFVDTHTPTNSADRVAMDKIVEAIAANN